jgi:hypothetical protein
MQAGESAGFAAALAVEGKTTPAALDPDALVRKLAENHVMVSFFNDVDVTSDDPRVAAAQYFGTKGFFASYDAKLNAPLAAAVKAAWQQGLDELKSGKLDPMKLARAVQAAEVATSPETKQTKGAALLAMWKDLKVQ